MKKSLLLLSVLVIVLTFGSAYAGSKTIIAGEYNGITVFEPASVASHDVTRAEYNAEPGLAFQNRVTVFDVRPAVSKVEGTSAGGLREEKPSKPGMELRNGITVF